MKGKSTPMATARALQRAVQRVRKIEGECRDLKRELEALKPRVVALTDWMEGAQSD